MTISLYMVAMDQSCESENPRRFDKGRSRRHIHSMTSVDGHSLSDLADRRERRTT